MKINKRDLKRIYQLLSEFHVSINDNISVLVEANKVIVPKEYRRYIQHVLLEKAGSAVIRSIVHGGKYIIELLDGKYYITREVDGIASRAIITNQEIKEFGYPEQISEDQLKKLIDYLERTRGAFGV